MISQAELFTIIKAPPLAAAGAAASPNFDKLEFSESWIGSALLQDNIADEETTTRKKEIVVKRFLIKDNLFLEQK